MSDPFENPFKNYQPPVGSEALSDEFRQTMIAHKINRLVTGAQSSVLSEYVEQHSSGDGFYMQIAYEYGGLAFLAGYDDAATSNDSLDMVGSKIAEALAKGAQAALKQGGLPQFRHVRGGFYLDVDNPAIINIGVHFSHEDPTED